MNQIEKIKQDISNISSAFEMAGYLDGIRVCAIIFCKANYPDEVYKTKMVSMKLQLMDL